MNLIGMKIDEVRIDGQMDRFRSDLDQLNQMGIEAVELPVHGLDAILKGRLSTRRMNEVTRILEDFEFAYSVHAPNPMNLMDQNEPSLHTDILFASLEFCRQVGAKALVVHPGRYIPEEMFGLFPGRSLSREREKSFWTRKP